MKGLPKGLAISSKWEQKGLSKFWSFCDDVIIESAQKVHKAQWIRSMIIYEYSNVLPLDLRFATASLVIFFQLCVLSYRPCVLPEECETLRWMRVVLSLYPNWNISGFSDLPPILFWLPKYSSKGSWQKRSVKVNSIPSLKRKDTHQVSIYMWFGNLRRFAKKWTFGLSQF